MQKGQIFFARGALKRFSAQRAKYTPLGQSPDPPMALHRLYNGIIMSMFHPFLEGLD